MKEFKRILGLIIIFAITMPMTVKAYDYEYVILGDRPSEEVPIRIGPYERGGVNTTVYDWAIGLHPGHERSTVIASDDEWTISVHAHEDRPWEIVVIGEVTKEVIFWIYVQMASRHSIGGQSSSWTSRNVWRMKVVVTGEGSKIIPIPDSANGEFGYQLLFRGPIILPRPDLEESEDTFYGIDADGLGPEIKTTIPEDDYYGVGGEDQNNDENLNGSEDESIIQTSDGTIIFIYVALMTLAGNGSLKVLKTKKVK